MHKIQAKQVFLFTAIVLVYTLIMGSCAQVAAPPGGKKDTLAPQIVSSIPAQKSKNYTGRKIELTFNEYVDIKNINQELLVTPSIGFFETKINPKGLSILLDSNLKQHTTYTFNFRNAVSDISERNVAKNVKVVFSTGDLIDSLSIKGNVKHLENNKNVENALVALYPYSDTLSIEKTKPYYFTKTDTSGNYILENLAAGKYYMASFIDINNNLLVNANKEAFDLYPEKMLDLKSPIENIHFKLSVQNRDSLKIIKTTTTAKTIFYELNRGIKTVSIQSSTNKQNQFVYQIENKQNIRLFKGSIDANDTLYLDIKTTDSLDREKIFKVKSKFREPNKKEKISKQVFNFNISPKPAVKFSPIDSIIIDFQKPISSWNIQKLYFKIDSLHSIPLEKNNIKINSYQNQLIIPHTIIPKEKVKLIIDKNAFISIEQDTSDKFEMPIEKEDVENYGLISGKLINPKKNTSYLVQLLNERDRSIAYQQITNEVFSFSYIIPETYLIRVIEDRNNDGYWTPGNIKTFDKPERIFFFSGKLKLKANFELTDNTILIE